MIPLIRETASGFYTGQAMRLWSLHPELLDVKGLTAQWREGLLAFKVLKGQTRGYRNHPQLNRFKAHPDPETAIQAFLTEVLEESRHRGYRFAADKIMTCRCEPLIPVTEGQVDYEWRFLLEKLGRRDPERQALLLKRGTPSVHPLFEVVPGPVESWEKI